MGDPREQVQILHDVPVSGQARVQDQSPALSKHSRLSADPPEPPEAFMGHLRNVLNTFIKHRYGALARSC